MSIRIRLRRLAVVFRPPLRWSAIVARWRASAAPSKGRPDTSASRPDFEPTRLMDRPGRTDAWGRSREVDVSEEELHTLPADLQDHFPRKRRQ